jgi:hypothetical protein
MEKCVTTWMLMPKVQDMINMPLEVTHTIKYKNKRGQVYW